MSFPFPKQWYGQNHAGHTTCAGLELHVYSKSRKITYMSRLEVNEGLLDGAYFIDDDDVIKKVIEKLGID